MSSEMSALLSHSILSSGFDCPPPIPHAVYQLQTACGAVFQCHLLAWGTVSHLLAPASLLRPFQPLPSSGRIGLSCCCSNCFYLFLLCFKIRCQLSLLLPPLLDVQLLQNSDHLLQLFDCLCFILCLGAFLQLLIIKAENASLHLKVQLLVHLLGPGHIHHLLY